MKKRRLFDSEGRLFGVISVVDILAVLVVAALAVMLVARYVTPPGSHYGQTDGGDTSTNARITCEVRISGVRESTALGIQPGDVLRNPDTGNVLGTVTSTRQEPYVQQINTFDGQVIEMETEGYIDVYLTFEGKGSVVDGHCYLDGATELVHNISIKFVTPYVSSVGRLMSFTYEVGA